MVQQECDTVGKRAWVYLPDLVTQNTAWILHMFTCIYILYKNSLEFMIFEKNLSYFGKDPKPNDNGFFTEMIL